MMGSRRRRWLAPEVVQTSVMDCGPAALKCLLEGFRIPVSYGRLREACQTDVDGTSIDALEEVARQLGLAAQQVLLPLDHIVLRKHCVLPALMTMRLPDGSTHFVVAWRRHGSWLQVMDPAAGRSWVRIDRFLPDLLRHEASVPLGEWRDFAASPDFVGPLRERLRRLGIGAAAADVLLRRALADPLWFTLGALDACLRFVTKVTAADALRPGKEAEALLQVLLDQTLASDGDIFRWVPEEYWSVLPDPESASLGEARLLVRGAVLITVSGTCPAEAPETLSPELAAALAEAPPGMVRLVWSHLRDEGRLAPLVLAGAVGVGILTTLVEALLFRGLFDIGIDFALGGQRLAAGLALVGFLAAALLFRLPIATEGLRLGRHLDARLRVALFTKLPRLADRYFHSRPVSDMAERAHAIQVVRSLPGMGAHLLQTFGELVATIVGVAVIDPRSTLFALAIATVSIGVPALAQRLISERDLRLRNQSGGLARLQLDALMGIAPIRAHHAETAIARQFESLLTEWTRTSLGHARAVLATEGVQAAGCTLLAGLLLLDHFQRSAGVTGSDLLLVYWTLRLPALADQAGDLARQYPAQRNILLRLVEPLTAPEPPEGPPSRPLAKSEAGAAISIRGGTVVAAGTVILREIDLTIAAGEHVAIVGLSGAGKSSLIGLLLGWHRLSEGTLEVDGDLVDAGNVAELRRRTAWVDPTVQLWNSPLLDNLLYASPDSNLYRVGRAVDLAAVRGIVETLPEGMQTALGEGGALVSGGEGQRVRLARALVQSGVTLALLDEPFRGLDRGQRAELLADLRTAFGHATLLCVTHDVGETRDFDRVLVIDDGRIVEDGAPAALAAQPSLYRSLLNAETLVHDQVWRGAHWRRLEVVGGQVRCTD